jgi:hypothetical protein
MSHFQHILRSLPARDDAATSMESDVRIFLPACLLVLACLTPSFPRAAPLLDGFALAAPVAPTPIRSGAMQRLAYEVHLTNYATIPLTLDRLDVLDPAHPAQPLASWSGAALQSLVALAGATPGDPSTRTVPPGRHAIAYLDISLPLQATVPRALVHRLAFHARDDEPARMVEGARTHPATPSAIVIGPPLRDGNWVAVYDPAMARGHRRVAFAIDGTLRVPARFAIDWMQVDDSGRLSHGDEQQLDHWLGYGADVLAVADARVVAVRDSMAEPARLGDSTHHPLEDASGNHVSLDLGGGRYVHYEHLKPGSVRVHVGQRVHRGESIARLGFTGDSTGPHLHLHVSDGASPLAGEGLPFAFDAFEQLGAYPSIEAFGVDKRWTDSAQGSRLRRDEMPEAQAVVRFRGQP